MGIIYETKWRGVHAWFRPSVRSMHQHLHDYVEVIYLRKGKLTVYINFMEYVMQPGDVIFAFPGQIHGHSEGPDAENITFLFPKDLPIYDAVFCNTLPQTPLLRGAVSPALDARFFEAAKANGDKELPFRKGIVQGHIALILGELLPHLTLTPLENAAETVEQRLIEYCSLHYRNPITLSEVAEALGYSTTYLSHLFASKFKIGFSKLIAAMRLEDAKKQLHGNTPITQIALDCGFGSMRNFNRTFKEATGMTPSEYRIAKKHP